MNREATMREDERLDAVQRYDVLDTPREEAFDRIAKLTQRIFAVSMTTIAFLDGHRQWFKARQGLDVGETERRVSICDTTIKLARTLIVPDTLEDERFRDNPLVTGAPFIRFYAGTPLIAPNRQILGTLCAMDVKPRRFEPMQVEMLEDLARIVVDELELRLLATTDGLTGAMSRRAFREEGARAVALAVRHRVDLACIVFDLDHFKAVNDTHGHAAGDAVLAGALAVCRARLRASDIVGRVGGEEFAVLLPHTSLFAAREVAEKLRTAIERSRFEGPDGPIQATASFGVAAMDRTMMDIDSLMQGADAALYTAKATGRNRTVEWTPVRAVAPGARRRVFKAGKIAFNQGRSSIDCTVRALSDAGAALDVISTAGVPDTFKLRIEADDFSRACHLLGKADKRLEVEFV